MIFLMPNVEVFLRQPRGVFLKLRLFATAIGIVLVFSACAAQGGDDGGASPSPTAAPTSETRTPTPEPTDGSDGEDSAQWETCEHPEGIVVSYPADWHVNDAGDLSACSAFDPEPFDDTDAAGDYIDSAVLLSVQPVEFGTAADPGALSGSEIERSETLVDGHDAVRIETEGSEDGARTTRWLIVGGRSRTISLVTHEAGNPDTYETNREVLDEMVTRLQLPDDV